MKTLKMNILLLGAAIALAACGSGSDESASSEQESLPKVKVQTVVSEPVAQLATYSATVESDVVNNLSPNSNLRIEKIYVDVGDVVHKGQVLVQLDASDLQQLKLQVDNQQVEFNRMASLYEVGGASKSEYDDAKMQLDVLATQYKQKLQNTQLTSPISGVVTARNYDDGDMYGSQPVLTIEQTNPVKLIVSVSEAYYKYVKKGMQVPLTLDAYEGETFQSTVTTVYPSVDANTHTFPVELTIDNSAQKVRPGMFARATINFGEIERVLVPDEAIVKQIGAGDRYVYTYKDGKVSYDKVELGRHIESNYEVVSGLEPGTQVVVAGQSNLRDGIAVEVIK